MLNHSIYPAPYQRRLIGGVWGPFFGDGSEKVLDSRASEQMRRWIRMPDAARGAISYLSEAIFGLAARRGAGNTGRGSCSCSGWT